MTNNGMYNFKIVAASQAKNTHKYKNSEKNILNCNANIFFNQQWLRNDLTPNYANTETVMYKKWDLISSKCNLHIRFKNTLKLAWVWHWGSKHGAVLILYEICYVQW
jgi:hypothetical protein